MSRPFLTRRKSTVWRRTRLTKGPGTPSVGDSCSRTSCYRPRNMCVYTYCISSNQSRCITASFMYSLYVASYFFRETNCLRYTVAYILRLHLDFLYHRQLPLIKIIIQQCIEPFLPVKLSLYVFKMPSICFTRINHFTHFATSTVIWRNYVVPWIILLIFLPELLLTVLIEC